MKNYILMMAVGLVLPCQVFADETGTCNLSGTCQYIIDGDGNVTISGTGEIGQYGAGYASHFFGRDDIKTITIKPGITEIGAHSFRNLPNLVSVTIPRTVTKIGSEAFYNASSLESIVIPKSVKDIEGSPFEYCSNLADITIEGENVNIGEYQYTFGTTFIYRPVTYTVLPGSATEAWVKGQAEKSKTWSTNVTIKEYKRKRIYTVEEANEIAGKKNRFSITYR